MIFQCKMHFSYYFSIIWEVLICVLSIGTSTKHASDRKKQKKLIFNVSVHFGGLFILGDINPGLGIAQPLS